MRILLLCNKSPYPASEGGPIAMNMIIEGLIHAGHTVKVLAISSNKYQVDHSDIPEEYRQKTGIELVYVDLSIKPLAAFRNLFPGHSYHVERFISPEFKNVLIRILVQENFDVVQFEMLYMSPYIELVRKYSNARIVLRAHNTEHLIWKRIADTTRNPFRRFYLGHLATRLKNYELSVILRFDGIAAITEQDAAFFRDAISRKSRGRQMKARAASLQHPADRFPEVIAIPFGIEPGKFPETTGESEFPSLFSIGAMDWIPNLDGIRWFLDHAWPEIHKKFPSLHYYLAGRNIPDHLKERPDPNVEIVGEVKNAADFMRSKAILLVPLFSGSGIRIKIIEGMALGKTIISTTLGAEGIHCTPGRDIFIADTAEQFVRSVSACVMDKSLCQAVGKEARDLVFREFNCEQIISRLLAFYQQIGA